MSEWDSLVTKQQTEEQENQTQQEENQATDAQNTTATQQVDTSSTNGEAAGAGNMDEMKQKIIDQIRTCYDPEIPVNIYELGLIYNIEVNPDTMHVDVDMTLTSPMCPVAGTLPLEVEDKVRAAEGVASAKVEVVWEPQWTPDMMSEAAKLDLGFDI